MHEPYEKPLAFVWSGTKKLDKALLTEVDVSRSQVIQRILEGLLCGSLVKVIELGRKENALAGDTGGLDALSNFLFVGVCSSRIDVLISILQSKLHSVLDSTGLGFPGTCTNISISALHLYKEDAVYPAQQ